MFLTAVCIQIQISLLESPLSRHFKVCTAYFNCIVSSYMQVINENQEQWKFYKGFQQSMSDLRGSLCSPIAIDLK